MSRPKQGDHVIVRAEVIDLTATMAFLRFSAPGVSQTALLDLALIQPAPEVGLDVRLAAIEAKIDCLCRARDGVPKEPDAI